MFEYITALAWVVLIAVLLDFFCNGSSSKEEASASATSRVVERLKNGGAQHVMAAQPTRNSTASPATSSAPPTKVFFKTAKPNAKFDTAFLAKANPVANVRVGELSQLQEAHAVAKGREIAANAIGEEPRNSRSSFSEEAGKGQERVRSTERRGSRSSFSEPAGKRDATPERASFSGKLPGVIQEQNHVSASEESVPPARVSSSEAVARPTTPEIVEEEVLVRGGSGESFSEAEGSERRRERRNSTDFVLLHGGPSPHASPAGVFADMPSPEASPASAGLPQDISEHERSIRVDYNGKSHRIPVHPAMTLQALRPLVVLAVGQADTQLRAAATGESLDASKDTRTLEDLGLMQDLHVLAE